MECTSEGLEMVLKKKAIQVLLSQLSDSGLARRFKVWRYSDPSLARMVMDIALERGAERIRRTPEGKAA